MGELEVWKADVVRILEERIRNWETLTEGEGSGLYTLGLRHAVDIVQGDGVPGESGGKVLHHRSDCAVYMVGDGAECDCGTPF